MPLISVPIFNTIFQWTQAVEYLTQTLTLSQTYIMTGVLDKKNLPLLT